MNRLTEEKEDKQLIFSSDEQKTQLDRSKEPEPETAEDIAKQVCIACKMNFRTGKGNGICAKMLRKQTQLGTHGYLLHNWNQELKQ